MLPQRAADGGERAAAARLESPHSVAAARDDLVARYQSSGAVCPYGWPEDTADGLGRLAKGPPWFWPGSEWDSWTMPLDAIAQSIESALSAPLPDDNDMSAYVTFGQALQVNGAGKLRDHTAVRLPATEGPLYRQGQGAPRTCRRPRESEDGRLTGTSLLRFRCRTTGGPLVFLVRAEIRCCILIAA